MEPLQNRVFRSLNRALSLHAELNPGSGGGYLSLALSSDQWDEFQAECDGDAPHHVLWGGQAFPVRKDGTLPEKTVVVEVAVSDGDIRDWMAREKGVKFLNARPVITTNRG